MKSVAQATFLILGVFTCCQAAVEEPKIRLTGGNTQYEGLVEINKDGIWLAICDNQMSMETANVLCRILGHASAINFHCCAEFGESDGYEVFDYIRCDGHEESIEDCHYRITEHYYDESMISEYQCGNDEDVGISCNPAEVRLKGGSHDHDMRSGRVEILHQSDWADIAAESMDFNLAIVLCRMLGYHHAKSFEDHAWRQSRGGVIDGAFHCNGDEDHFNDCAFVREETASNRSSSTPRLAGITCITFRIILSTSRNSPPNEGNVKFFFNNGWQNMCSNSWGEEEANVACRMLGYEGGTLIVSADKETGGSAMLQWVDCDGTETSLAYCQMSGIHRVNCRDAGYARVTCSGEAVIPFRLAGGPDPSEGRVEIFYHGAWGTICADELDFTRYPDIAQNDARVICRALGYPDALDAECCAHYGQGVGAVLMEMPRCHGKESHILSCPHWDWYHTCNHAHDFGVSCQKNYDLEVRLVGGTTPGEGRVEVFHEESWGTICDDNWDLSDANVVCRMLGFERAETHSCCAAYGEGSGDIIFDDVECTGTESNIGHCRRNKHRSHDCTHAEDVGVKCFGTSPLITESTELVAISTESHTIVDERTAPHKWYLSGDKALGLIITLVILFLIVNIAIVVLSVKIHRYRTNPAAEMF